MEEIVKLSGRTFHAVMKTSFHGLRLPVLSRQKLQQLSRRETASDVAVVKTCDVAFDVGSGCCCAKT